MRILFLSVILLFLCTLPSQVFAEGEFISSSSVYYDVDENGRTKVAHYITLENVFTDFYATSYALNLVGIKPSQITAFEGTTALQTQTSTLENGSLLIKVQFPNTVVGKGAKREFNIKYQDATIATKSGSVWEVSIPRLSDPKSFADYSVTLNIPASFGQMAYISPEPFSKKTAGLTNTYIFLKDNLTKTTVSAAFGDFQVFNFDLTYHLENPLNKKGLIEIAIPPDNAYQKVIVDKLEPKPQQVYIDPDGNWLAEYILSPRQRLDVKALGVVQIFAQPSKQDFDFTQSIEWSKKSSPVWQTEDPQILKLAQELKNPKAIYDYVVKTLSYDFERAKPNVNRLGALEALKNPKSAICMEFTDLFVAIARAAGIPAREVNGYAYTENPELQPLSLVADVLHSWAEYWDFDKNIWVAVDPTWGSTTNGIDFFSKLDLRHFTFVNHGHNPYQPYPAGSYKLGANPQKDVFVTFGTLPENKSAKPSIRIISTQKPILHDMKITARILNEGNTALHNSSLDIYFEDKKIETVKINTLPPFGSQDIEANVPFSLVGTTIPENVSFVIGDRTLRVPTNKASIIAVNILALFSILLVLVLLLYAKTKKFTR